jgi:hypothetical protein
MFNHYSVTDSENKHKALKKVEKYRKSKRAVAISQKHRWTLQAGGQNDRNRDTFDLAIKKAPDGVSEAFYSKQLEWLRGADDSVRLSLVSGLWSSFSNLSQAANIL